MAAVVVGRLVSTVRFRGADVGPRLPAASATATTKELVPAVRAVAGVNVQVWAVLLTLALPSRVVPLNTRKVSPLAKAVLRVPERVGVVSSVAVPSSTEPWRRPVLSLTAVMAAAAEGAVVSRTKERAGWAAPTTPLAETTRAVIK
jgi:hypothetical protein